MRVAIGLGAAVMLAACAGHVVDLGGSPAAGGSDAVGETESGSGSSGGSPLDGTWTGYFESYTLPSGSDVLSMTFAGAPGSVTGTVKFGTKAAPPPPTDPNVGYPPGLGDNMQPLVGFQGEGFVFTASGITLEAPRLQLGVGSDEEWSAWCALVSSYGQEPDGGGPTYGCLPNWGCSSGNGSCSQPNPSTNQTVPVDCGKMFLCLGGGCGGIGPVCQCTATSCGVDLSTADITFDMQLADDHLDGSIAGPTLGNHNVHLTRSP